MLGKKEIEAKEEVTFKILPSDMPNLPEYEDPTKIDIRYPLIAPFVTAHIYWNNQTNELLYDIEEPILSDEERNTLELIEEGVNGYLFPIGDAKKLAAVLDTSLLAKRNHKRIVDSVKHFSWDHVIKDLEKEIRSP